MKRDALEEKLLVLQGLIESNHSVGIRQLLAELVPEYAPASDIADWNSGATTPMLATRCEFGSSLLG